jgi:hypothetical protein
MDFVYNVVVVLHFIGLASLVGGFLVQMSSSAKGVNPAMLHGALTQLVTGVILVGLAEGGAVDYELNMTKITVKLVVVLIITALAFLGRRPGVSADRAKRLWAIIGALALLNVIISVFW